MGARRLHALAGIPVIDLTPHASAVATDLVVRKYPAVAGNQTVLAKYRNTTTPVTELVFNARGFLQKSAIVFTVCGQAAYAKGFQIEIEPVGLADVKEVPNLCS